MFDYPQTNHTTSKLCYWCGPHFISVLWQLESMSPTMCPLSARHTVFYSFASRGSFLGRCLALLNGRNFWMMTLLNSSLVVSSSSVERAAGSVPMVNSQCTIKSQCKHQTEWGRQRKLDKRRASRCIRCRWMIDNVSIEVIEYILVSSFRVFKFSSFQVFEFFSFSVCEFFSFRVFQFFSLRVFQFASFRI